MEIPSSFTLPTLWPCGAAVALTGFALGASLPLVVSKFAGTAPSERLTCEGLEKIQATCARIEEALQQLSTDGVTRVEAASAKIEATVGSCIERLEATPASAVATVRHQPADERTDRVEAALQQLPIQDCVERVEAALQQLPIHDSVERVEAPHSKMDAAPQKLSNGGRNDMDATLNAIGRLERMEATHCQMDVAPQKLSNGIRSDMDATLNTSGRLERMEATHCQMDVAPQKLPNGIRTDMDTTPNTIGRLERMEAAIRVALQELGAEVQRKVAMQGPTVAEWDVSGVHLDGKKSVWSVPFALAGVQGLRLDLAPQGYAQATPGHASLYLHGPPNVLLAFRVTMDGITKQTKTARLTDKGRGWVDFCEAGASFSKISLEMLDVVRQVQTAEAQAH